MATRAQIIRFGQKVDMTHERNGFRAETGGRRSVGTTIAEGVRGWAILLASLLTLGSAAFAAGASTSLGQFLVVLSAALGLAASGGLVGGFVGMLFGMPREAEVRPDAPASHARYAFNSNLLKVSDWVTTILVGLSLVSLRSIPGAMKSFGDWLAPALGGTASSGAFGVFLTIAAFAAMFMLLYIWSSIPLRGHLEDEAFDTEQQWASVLRQVAAGRNPGEISETLRAVSPKVLEEIHTDELRTPPILRELAQREQARRSGGGAPDVAWPSDV